MPHEAKGMRWGEEERTSLPDPQIHTDDPTPLGYGGMIPSHLFHIEQRFQYQWIDLPLLISKILQSTQNVLLEKVDRSIELIEIVYLILFSIIK